MTKNVTDSKSFLSVIKRNKKNLILLSMVAPGAIWFLLLRYLPMPGIIIAFKDYKVYPKDPGFINNVFHSEWVGLKNFEFMFASTDSWEMIRNTLVYNAIFIILGIVIAVTFAIMLNEIRNKKVAKTYQTLMFFPYFLSWVVVSYFLEAFLSPTGGLIVELQKSLGVEVIDWYNNPEPWPFLIVLANQWKGIGYGTILYLSAITGIDATQYEAASIDGASKWQQIKFVTLPHIKPMIIILFIMNVGRIFNSDFGLFFSVPMNSGPLQPVTQVIDTYVYRAMMSGGGELGMGTAAGLLQNVLGFICIMAANTFVRKVDEDSSLF